MGMNLYSVLFRHYSQKDSEEGISQYIVKESDSDMYDYVDEEYNCNTWFDNEYEELEQDPDTLSLEQRPYKQKLIECKGQMFDDDYYPSDLYYGATAYGWELVKENISNDDIEVLKRLGILKEQNLAGE